MKGLLQSAESLAVEEPSYSWELNTEAGHNRKELSMTICISQAFRYQVWFKRDFFFLPTELSEILIAKTGQLWLIPGSYLLQTTPTCLSCFTDLLLLPKFFKRCSIILLYQHQMSPGPPAQGLFPCVNPLSFSFLCSFGIPSSPKSAGDEIKGLSSHSCLSLIILQV